MTNLPIEKRPRWFTTELAATLFAALPMFLTAVGGIVKGLREETRGFTEQLGIGIDRSRRRDAKHPFEQRLAKLDAANAPKFERLDPLRQRGEAPRK